MADAPLRRRERRYGVQANVYRVHDHAYSYRWLGSRDWHQGDLYPDINTAIAAARADVEGRGMRVEIVFG